MIEPRMASPFSENSWNCHGPILEVGYSSTPLYLEIPMKPKKPSAYSLTALCLWSDPERTGASKQERCGTHMGHREHESQYPRNPAGAELPRAAGQPVCGRECCLGTLFPAPDVPKDS